MEKKIIAMHVYKGRISGVGDYHLAINGIESVDFIENDKIRIRLSENGTESICNFGRRDIPLNPEREFVVTAEGIGRVDVLLEGEGSYKPLARTREFDSQLFHPTSNNTDEEGRRRIVDFLMREIGESSWKVSRDAVAKCVDAWANHGTAGVRDEENGVFVRTDCVALVLGVEELNPLCVAWQTDYLKEGR